MKNKSLKWEYKTIEAMISLSCMERHSATKGELCPACRELLDYAHSHLDKCPYNIKSHSKGYRGADEDANKDSRMKAAWYQERKPTCALCPIHCYKSAMREQIRDVMRYAGPRMFRHHPILSIRHLLEEWKTVTRPPKG